MQGALRRSTVSDAVKRCADRVSYCAALFILLEIATCSTLWKSGSLKMHFVIFWRECGHGWTNKARSPAHFDTHSMNLMLCCMSILLSAQRQMRLPAHSAGRFCPSRTRDQRKPSMISVDKTGPIRGETYQDHRREAARLRSLAASATTAAMKARLLAQACNEDWLASIAVQKRSTDRQLAPNDRWSEPKRSTVDLSFPFVPNALLEGIAARLPALTFGRRF